MPPFVLGAVRNSNDPRASVLIWHAEKPRAENGDKDADADARG